MFKQATYYQIFCLTFGSLIYNNEQDKRIIGEAWQK
jgi:hypothetical protein